MITETSISKASVSVQRGRFSTNVLGNLANFGLNIVIGIWFVPFLIHHLGTAAYGLVPLATTMTSYLTIITLGLNSAVGRSIAIALEQGDDARADQIFNTSLLGSILLAAVLFIPGLWLSLRAEQFLNLPAGSESSARWLFFCTVIAFLLTQVMTPFSVASFCRNRFDLLNLVTISQTLTRVGLTALLFTFSSPQVWHVGVGIVAGALVSSFGSLQLWRILTPSLRICPQRFDWPTLKSLTGTGGWVIFNQIGTLLFLSIDLLVVNRLFGADSCGRYAAVLQWSVLLRTLAGTISAVFTPTIVSYCAQGDIDGLISYMRQAVKFLGLSMALPIGLICGLAGPLLHVWLGAEFSNFALLMCLMTGHLCVNLAVLPLFAVQLAMDRVRLPGIISLVAGAINLGLSLLLASTVNWKLYGVAAAGAIVLTTKNTVFTPLYGALILRQRYDTFLREIVPIISVTFLIAGLCRLTCVTLHVYNAASLITVGLGISLLYVITAYHVLLTPKERLQLGKLRMIV